MKGFLHKPLEQLTNKSEHILRHFVVWQKEVKLMFVWSYSNTVSTFKGAKLDDFFCFLVKSILV